MFVTIRRYNPKNGSVNRASLQLLRRQVQDEFLPIIRQIPGFRAYYVTSVADREVVTLTICDSIEGAAECARCAAEYTLRNPLVYELGKPEVTDGEVLTWVESPPEAPQADAAATALALWYEESHGMLLTASER